jgi:hypothetical protein
MFDFRLFARNTSVSGRDLSEVQVDQFLSIRIVVRVKWLKTVAVFGFLAFWLVASNHCRLELVPGLDFLACQEDGTPLPEKSCETDGCAAVESGFYKMEDAQTALSAPSLAPLLSLTLLVPRLLVRLPPVSRVTPDSVPPELPVTWQFSSRAVAPPRAPSLVS